MNSETLETIPEVEPELALAKRADPPAPPVQITAAQAKVEAVAHLTMKAYEMASTLKLSQEEIEGLQRDFEDEAFKPGAAGKENLIYIEHAFLRDRLNQVIGPGQWAIVPRNRWAEPFKTNQGKDGSRVYVEAMLLIRGAFVAESVGAMEYYPSNAAQNYGDAVEGAKTAAFRRCAKELGVGLQAWKKDWCDGWWKRQRSPRTPQPTITPPPAKQNAPQANPGAQASVLKPPTEATRTWMLGALNAAAGQPAVKLVSEFFTALGALIPGEPLEELSLEYVPNTPAALKALGKAIADFEAGGEAGLPYPKHDLSAPAPKQAKTPVLPEGMAEETGELQAVTLKEGKSAKGPWSLWGLKVNDVFHNTFSNTIGQAAKAAKGKVVTIIYTQGEKGRNIHDLVIDGISVENPQ